MMMMKKNILLACICFGFIFQSIAQNSEITPGGLKNSSLSGTGIRPVFSNSNGQLVNQSSNNQLYISIPAANFHTIDYQPLNFTLGEVAGPFNTQMKIIASVGDMPHGIRVTGMRVCFKDNNQVTNLEVKLLEVFPDPALTTITTTTLATTTSGSNGPNYQCVDSALNKVFDYSKNSYYIETRPIAAGADVAFWSGNLTDLSLTHVILFYNY